ncbi:MAG: DUF484 family protein [Sphingomicrobium sp.]
MGQLIQFEDRALARLRERLGEAEEATEDLIAFARGHSDAVASIHAAVLVAIEAPSVDRLLEAVTRRWPEILGIDAVAVAIVVGERGFRADCGVIDRVEAAFVERMLLEAPPVDVRSVGGGHPLFGSSASARIRAEALIRIDFAAPFPRGLLALGQEAELALDSSHGSELLRFLGKTLGATLRRFVATA